MSGQMESGIAVARKRWKQGIQQRPRRELPLLTVFKEGYELRLCDVNCVTPSLLVALA